MRLRIGARLFEGAGPFLMGVVNVTPDSFSDGGRFLAPEAAVARAERLVDEGADLLDLGGESTRPGSAGVSAAEEAARVVPVISALRARGCTVPLSVDTAKPEVARAALRAGADLVNDVTGLRDPEMRRLVAEAGVPAVLMHMRGTPADMQGHARYRDVVGEVAAELEAALAEAVRAGVAEERVVLDPGLGFAKTAEQSLALLAGLPRLRALGRPLLVGPSRKSFIGAVTGPRWRPGSPAPWRRWPPASWPASRSSGCTTWPRPARRPWWPRRCGGPGPAARPPARLDRRAVRA